MDQFLKQNMFNEKEVEEMVKEIKKVRKLDQLKKEYNSLAEFIEEVPDHLMIFKKDMQIYDKKSNTLNDKLILVYEIAEKRNSHFSERTKAYVRDKKSGKVRLVDQERLRRELGDLLLNHFNNKSFMDDFVITLTPMELIEAYDRAVVKKGKVKQTEGCSKFVIHGHRGPPMELMLRQ